MLLLRYQKLKYLFLAIYKGIESIFVRGKYYMYVGLFFGIIDMRSMAGKYGVT